MNAYNKIVSDFNKESTNLLLIGFDIYNKFCEAGRIKDLDKLCDFLTNEKIFNVAKAYVELYINGDINEDDFYLGLGLFKATPNIQLGVPITAVNFRYGADGSNYKENKTISQKGEVIERTYYAGSRKIEREVVAHVFRFVNGKLDKYEDKSENTYFSHVPYARGTEAGIGYNNVKESDSITLIAFSDAEKDYKQEDLDLFKKFVSKRINKDIIVGDIALNSKINLFTYLYNEDGGTKDRYFSINELLQIHRNFYNGKDLKSEDIIYATNVLKNSTKIEKTVIKTGKEFITKYDELTQEIAKVLLKTTAELKAENIPFNDKRNIIDSVVEECQINLTNNLQKGTLEIPFESEVKDFKEALIFAEEQSKKPCFIATATMGDYNHPDVVELRMFRDNFLSKRVWGRVFTKIYYKLGPIPARAITKSTQLKQISYLLIVKPLSKFASKVKKYS